jgi:integrase
LCGENVGKVWGKFYICGMATIKFIIRSDSDSSSIYVRLKEGRAIDLTAKTKYITNSKDWSATKGQPKNLILAANKKLNQNLEELRTDLLEHYNNSVDNKTINTQWLKDFINPSQDEGSIPTKLVEYFDYYGLHKESTIEESTHKKLVVNKHLLKRFQEAEKTVYFIKDVNADFKLKFEEYCKKQNYAPNTIARAIKFIKTICYHARNNGIETHFQLNSITAKFEKVDKIYLTIEEIEKIQKKEFEQEYLINAKDWLIISCETGQRVSDFMRFKKEQIRYEGNVPLIEFTQVKTGKTMAIPLSKKVLEILKKRDGEFPRQISDQRYNEYIKEVCKIAEIKEKVKGAKTKTEKKVTRKESGTFEKWELVTSHIGRRSFSTNNYGRIPTSLLINVTGHSTETMFLEYIGKTVTEKAIQLAEYF